MLFYMTDFQWIDLYTFQERPALPCYLHVLHKTLKRTDKMTTRRHVRHVKKKHCSVHSVCGEVKSLRAVTCFTRGRPGENFLLVMAGFPIPIFSVMGTMVGDSSDTLELETICYAAEQQENS